MKRSVRITLIVIGILLVLGVWFGYQIYLSVVGNETLNGKQDKIPTETVVPATITKGVSDWPNWRGPFYDGKSGTTGLST